MIKGSVPQFREVENTPLRERFLTRSIPLYCSEQISLYTQESLLAQSAGQFNPREVNKILAQKTGARALVCDIGGDKMKVGEAIVKEDGRIHITRTEVVARSKGDELGSTYVDPLIRLGQAANNENLPVGISTAGVVREGHVDGTYNIKHLVEAVDNEYGGDMKRLVPTLTSLENDAPPPLKATLVEVVRKYPEITNAIEIILGGGLGGTVFLGEKDGNGTISTLEPGHVPAVTQLREVMENFEVTQLCEVGGEIHPYVCVENVAGGKAMERTLRDLLGKNHPVGGHEMVDIIENGSVKDREITLTVLDNAANIVAHVVEGIDHAYDGQLLSHPESTLLAWHGGIFEVPGFRERVEQILSTRLQEKLGREVDLVTLKTSDVNKDVALVGAAIAALSK